MKSFTNLDVWNKAHKLTLKTYEVTEDFPSEEQYRLTDQICRSASSVPANIACPVESLKSLQKSIPQGLAPWNFRDLKYLYSTGLRARLAKQPRSISSFYTRQEEVLLKPSIIYVWPKT